MSAFLGPIHHWLYHKIQLQEALIGSLLETARQNSWNTQIEEKLDAVCGKADLRPLEEVIDHANIHGWLQERISVVETRFAFLVTQLLKEDPARLSDLKQAAYHFGTQHPVSSDAKASVAFQALTDSLLDGMPCDHANQILEQEEDRVVWRQAQCLHNKYWEQAGGDINVYYALRAQLIEGMLAESGLKYLEAENKLFEIRKEL